MRPRPIALILIALLVTAVAPTTGAASQPRPIKAPWGPAGRHTQRFVGGEVLVRFEHGVSATDRRAAHRALGGRVLQELLLADTYLVELPRGVGVRDAVRGYEGLDAVSYASPNFKRYLMATPNDTRFAEMWGLNNTGQNTPASNLPTVAGADINATAAWDGPTGFPGMGTGVATTVVAVIDDGVTISHPDLDGNIFQNTADPLGGGDQDGNGLVDDTNGWDFIDRDRNVVGADTHGTHVAGTIGAEGNNGTGVTGVSWDVSLLPVRIFNNAGASSLAAVVNAYVYSGLMGADVANGSFGGPGKTQLEIDALRASKSTLFVVASGNGGTDGIADNNDTTPTFPCNYDEPNVMCVGATDSADRLTSFSNFGHGSVHIAAPGEAILSTSSDGGYQFLQGTSMATPHVAGTAALIFQTQPNANPFSIRRALMASADPLPLSADVAKIFPGSGRLNADAFLDEDATPLGVPTMTSSALKRAFQKKTSVAMNVSASSAVGYRLWDERTKYNSRSRSSLFHGSNQSSVRVPAAAGFTHCFAAASREAVTGNQSNFSQRKCTAVPVDDKTAKHSSGWKQRTGRGYYLKTYSQSSKKGASLTLPKVFFHRLALVATKCKGCGKVGLFLTNGSGKLALFKKISLASTRTKKAQVIPMFVKPGLFKAKVVIKVLTSGKTVKVEGIGVSQV